MADFFIKTSDTAPSIRGTCTDHAGTPVDITGATVHIAVQPFDGETILYAEASNDQVGDGSDGTRGYVSYDWDPNDTLPAGPYWAEWQLTFVGDAVETFPNDGYFTIAIIEDLGTVAS